jgi:hypothetical protein
MRVVILYRPNSEYARRVEEFVHEFERRETSRKIELIDYDSRTGTDMASLYGVMDQPAILALADDSQVLQMWVGPELPLMDDVAAYSISGLNFEASKEKVLQPL